MKSLILAILIMLGLATAAKAQDIPEGCDLYAAIAKGATKARDKGIDEEVVAARALSLVNTDLDGQRAIILLVKMIYESSSARGLDPEAIQRVAYHACIGK